MAGSHMNNTCSVSGYLKVDRSAGREKGKVSEKSTVPGTERRA